MIKIDVSNLKVLEEYFAEMSRGDKRKIFLSAFRRCAKPILQAAKTLVPRKTGRLARSLASDGVQGQIALEAGAMRRRGGYTGHLNESGTTERFYITRKNSKRKSTGRMTATHFFENAYNSVEKQTDDIIANEIFSEVSRRIDRARQQMK